MKIKIEITDFQKAVDELFTSYGIQSHEILDFTEISDGFEFEVSKVPEVEIELRNKVDNIIKSNNFSTDDIAFICSDNKVRTPEGGNLFERIKSLLVENVLPIIGFTNLIDAYNQFSDISELIDTSPVAYQNVILTKEGNLLKGTKVKTVRSVNSKLSDPLIEINISLNNPTEFVNKLEKAAKDAKLDEYLSVDIIDNKVYVTLTMMTPIDIFDLTMSVMKLSSGIKRFTIKGGGYEARCDMK